VKEETIVRKSTSGRRKRPIDWARSDAVSDEEIAAAARDDPDAAPIADASFWREAKVALPETKERITIRLDRDILEYFRQQGQYQTRINAILRAYVEHERDR
jgi:uncharacterized protein (DUF4415 family)